MNDDFPAFVRSLGLRPTRALSPDGKIHRCPTEAKPKRKNGAYMWALDGSFGWAQDWTTMPEPATWQAGEDIELPEYDPSVLRKAREEKWRKQKAAIHRAREFFGGCTPLRGGHPYLDSHDLDMTGCSGLKVDLDGWLVVPAKRGRQLQTIQRISPEGDKRFFPGAPVSGSSYRIQPRRSHAVVTIVCEGLATGLALYRAVPNSRIIVAWHTGNLADVEVPQSGLVAYAADNDHGTESKRGTNPGIEAARKAAEQIGCGLTYPDGIRGTDWSDYRQERIREIGEPKYGTLAKTAQRVEAEIRRRIMAAATFVTPHTGAP